MSGLLLRDAEPHPSPFDEEAPCGFTPVAGPSGLS